MDGPRTDNALRAELALHKAESGLSIVKLARKIGYSDAVISQYLNLDASGGTSKTSSLYPGDTEKLERRVREYLRNSHLQKRERVVSVENDVSRSVARAIETIRRTNDIGAIFGAAGIGKSRGIGLYVTRPGDNSISLVAKRWACDEGWLMHSLWQQVSRAGYANERRGDWIARQLAGSDRTLIIDNAHKLTRPAIQCLFDLWDEIRCPIAFVGNPELMDKIEDNDQRFSRIGYRVRVKARVARDLVCHQIAELAPASGSELIERCAEVAESAGHFRAVEKRLQLAVQIKEGGKPSWSWLYAFEIACKKLQLDAGEGNDE